LSQGGLAQQLTFGVRAGTTDVFDADVDVLAPPPPPSGVLDGRFTGGADDLLTDIRPPAEMVSWTLQVQHASSEALTLSWNPSLFPEDVSVSLKDAITGSILSVDMTTASEALIPSGLTTLQIVFKTTVTEQVSYTAGWNMIGVPLSGVDQTYEDLFTSEVTGSLFRFATSYSPVADGMLSMGEGYWLRLGLPETVSYEGTPESSVTWDLSTGWNMVSGTTCEVSRSDIEALGGITASTLFGYAGGYQLADAIAPGRAYWIRATEALQLSVPCASAGKAREAIKGREAIASTAQEPLFDFSMSLQTSDSQPPRSIRAGLHAQASDAFDEALDQLAPPAAPAGSLDARFTTASGDMYHDYRSVHDAAITWDVTFSAPENASLLLSWDRVKLSKAGVFRLTDLQGKGDVDLDMTEVGELYISAGSPLARARGLRIHFIPSASLVADEDALPEAYDLAAAFPNPFNPTTTIAFELPEMSPVTIQVYDVLGRRVAMLVNTETLPAGQHRIQFDASSMASGVYIVHMQAGSFQDALRITMSK